MNAVEHKRFATLRAELALKGFAAFEGQDDAGRPLFIVSKWAMTRQLQGLPELERFVAQVAPRTKQP